MMICQLYTSVSCVASKNTDLNSAKPNKGETYGQKCGRTEIFWYRQSDTEEVIDLEDYYDE